MVVIDYSTTEEERYVYYDDRLVEGMKKVRQAVQQKDKDYFFAVDGEEGSGKSVFTLQLAKLLDSSFCLDRVVFTPDDFQRVVIHAKKGQVVVFDEAFRGLSSRGALNEVNKLLVALMMECRQKNLIVFIVMPSFFLLDKYVALHRARGLFHVYERHGKRGFWRYYNRKKKKLLYLKGHKTYSYAVPKTSFRGRFLDQYAIDEVAYRTKKRRAFESNLRVLKSAELLQQRNALLWFLVKEVGMGTSELSQRLQNIGVELKHNSISEIVTKKTEEMRDKGVLL